MKNQYLYSGLILLLSVLLFGYFKYVHRDSFSPQEYIDQYSKNESKYKFNFVFEDCLVDLTMQPAELKTASKLLSSKNEDILDNNIIYFIFEYESLTGQGDSLSMDNWYSLEKSIYLEHNKSLLAPVVFIPENSGFITKKQRFYCGFELGERGKPFGDFKFKCDLPCIENKDGLPIRITPKMVPQLKYHIGKS